MKILVCVKQVPKHSNVKFDENNNLIRENLKMEMNLHDKFAIEMALSIKDKNKDSSIDLITMGLPNTKDMLIEYLEYGLNKGYIVSDKCFGGADTLATSYTLATAIKDIGDYDIIICGTQSSDGATGQVGPQIAEHLNLNLISSVKDIDINDNKINAIRENGKYIEKITANLPCLLTCNASGNSLRELDTFSKKDVSDEQIIMLSCETFNINTDKTGFKGSATVVGDSYEPKKPESALVVEEENMEKSIDKLFEILEEKKLIV